jgi:hypothetical protein
MKMCDVKKLRAEMVHMHKTNQPESIYVSTSKFVYPEHATRLMLLNMLRKPTLQKADIAVWTDLLDAIRTVCNVCQYDVEPLLWDTISERIGQAELFAWLEMWHLQMSCHKIALSKRKCRSYSYVVDIEPVISILAKVSSAEFVENLKRATMALMYSCGNIHMCTLALNCLLKSVQLWLPLSCFNFSLTSIK